jgi:ribulose-phosphate 3-epimerase
MTEHAVLHGLLGAVPLIAPSMLKCDFANLHREAALLESAGAKLLHLDVMDGHFVPNLSYGPVVISSLRAITKLPFEAHLMISEPERYLDAFLEAGCNLVTFHIEAVPEPTGLLRRIRQGGAAAGLALNPETPVDLVGRDRLLSIDGGIGPATIPLAARAGACEFVVGSAIFDEPDYREAIDNMHLAASGAAVPANLE